MGISQNVRYHMTLASLLHISAEIVSQVTNCCVIFELGSLPLILGKITTSLAKHGTVRPGHGSLMAARSQNGKTPDGVLSCGSMENVSYNLALILSQKLIVIPFLSGRWKECPLVR
jgi:hypothetical protein